MTPHAISVLDFFRNLRFFLKLPFFSALSSKILFLLLFTLYTFSLSANLPPNDPPPSSLNIQFTPPPNWRFADNTVLPKHVHLMVVGKGSAEFPPSISLATETYSGTVKHYLKVIKELNTSKGFDWKNLGPIQTEAGTASLSQTDNKSQWGEIKMIHVILKKDNQIYIATAAALKDEFPKFYKEIFTSLRTLRFTSETTNLTP